MGVSSVGQPRTGFKQAGPQIAFKAPKKSAITPPSWKKKTDARVTRSTTNSHLQSGPSAEKNAAITTNNCFDDLRDDDSGDNDSDMEDDNAAGNTVPTKVLPKV